MTSTEIRASFLKFSARAGRRSDAALHQRRDEPVQGHVSVRDKRDYTRAATAQKVMRVSGKHNDLDNVCREGRG